eukprot:ANDGO_08359.mRNA.1 hypothetical protein
MSEDAGTLHGEPIAGTAVTQPCEGSSVAESSSKPTPKTSPSVSPRKGIASTSKAAAVTPKVSPKSKHRSPRKTKADSSRGVPDLETGASETDAAIVESNQYNQEIEQYRERNGIPSEHEVTIEDHQLPMVNRDVDQNESSMHPVIASSTPSFTDDAERDNGTCASHMSNKDGGTHHSFTEPAGTSNDPLDAAAAAAVPVVRPNYRHLKSPSPTSNPRKGPLRSPSPCVASGASIPPALPTGKRPTAPAQKKKGRPQAGTVRTPSELNAKTVAAPPTILVPEQLVESGAPATDPSSPTSADGPKRNTERIEDHEAAEEADEKTAKEPSDPKEREKYLRLKLEAERKFRKDSEMKKKQAVLELNTIRAEVENQKKGAAKRVSTLESEAAHWKKRTNALLMEKRVLESRLQQCSGDVRVAVQRTSKKRSGNAAAMHHDSSATNLADKEEMDRYPANTSLSVIQLEKKLEETKKALDVETRLRKSTEERLEHERESRFKESANRKELERKAAELTIRVESTKRQMEIQIRDLTSQVAAESQRRDFAEKEHNRIKEIHDENRRRFEEESALMKSQLRALGREFDDFRRKAKYEKRDVSPTHSSSASTRPGAAGHVFPNITNAAAGPSSSSSSSACSSVSTLTSATTIVPGPLATAREAEARAEKKYEDRVRRVQQEEESKWKNQFEELNRKLKTEYQIKIQMQDEKLRLEKAILRLKRTVANGSKAREFMKMELEEMHGRYRELMSKLMEEAPDMAGLIAEQRNQIQLRQLQRQQQLEDAENADAAGLEESRNGVSPRDAAIEEDTHEHDDDETPDRIFKTMAVVKPGRRKRISKAATTDVTEVES